MNDTVDLEKRKRGRPRSTTAETAILRSTLELMDAGGFRGMTCDAIAKRAGVSKATLYKWWPNKTYLALDALMTRVRETAPVPDTGDALEDFIANVKGLAQAYNDPEVAPALLELLGESLGDPALLTLFRDRYFSVRRAGVKIIVERGIARGQIRGDIPMETILDLIYGPLVLRLLTGHGVIDAEFAESLARTAFAGLSPR